MGRLSRQKPLPQQVMELIEYSLHMVQYGYLILTVQDGCIVKMERTEKFIFSAKNKISYIRRENPTGKHSLQAKIFDELQGLQYGQLIIRLEDGRVEQIEKTEKRRINEFEGIDGDGI